jgi:hypothetical protein
MSLKITERKQSGQISPLFVNRKSEKQKYLDEINSKKLLQKVVLQVKSAENRVTR